MPTSNALARSLTALAAALFFLSHSPAPAFPATDEWVPIGPLGGTVFKLAVHPTDCLNIYLPTGGKLYHTIDGGAKWDLVSSCPDLVTDVWIVLSSPPVLYVSANYYRLYRSMDEGETWTELSARGYCLAFDKRYPQRMFAGTSGGRVLKSVDGGATWTAFPTGTLNPIMAIAVSPGDSNTVFAADWGDCDVPGSGIFKTTDGGLTWQSADEGIGYTDVAGIFIDPVHPDTIFASTTGCAMYWSLGLFRSIDGGGSWSAVNTGLPCAMCPYDIDIGDFEAIPGAEGSYYALTEGKAFRSDDGGVTWTMEDTNVDDDVLALEFFAPDPSIRFFGAAHGLWRSTPSSAERFGVVPILQSGIAVNPIDPSILYTIGDIAYKSVDRGATWNLLRNGSTWATGKAIAINPQQPDILYVGDYQGPSEVYRSIDGGASWDTSLGLATEDIKIDPVNPSVVYAAGNSGLFKTLDGGDTWSRVEVDRAVSIAIHPFSPSTIYIGTVGYGIKKSEDGGATWTLMNGGLPADLTGKFFLALGIDPLHPDTLYCGGSGSVGIYKSTTGGALWAAANAGLTNLDVRNIVIDPLRPSILYAQGGYGAVHRSIDGARSWELINAGLETGWFAHDIALDPASPNVLYFCADAGLFRYESSFDPFADASRPEMPPIDIRSYPNPFSRGATVEFVVARRGDARVALYDVAGRRVAVLADGWHEPGRYRAAIDGGRLSPGVYFIRASIDGRAFSRKCIHLK